MLCCEMSQNVLFLVASSKARVGRVIKAPREAPGPSPSEYDDISTQVKLVAFIRLVKFQSKGSTGHARRRYARVIVKHVQRKAHNRIIWARAFDGLAIVEIRTFDLNYGRIDRRHLI